MAFILKFVEQNYLQHLVIFPDQICISNTTLINLNGKLWKALNLTYSSSHPEDNKQNVELATAIIHDTTITACQSYFPEKTRCLLFRTGFVFMINCRFNQKIHFKYAEQRSNS